MKPRTTEHGYTAQQRAELAKVVATYVTPGQEVGCILRSVAESGMTRRISLYVVTDGGFISLDHRAAILTDRTVSPHGGIVCKGCGMDMGWDLVRALSDALSAHTGTPYDLRHVWL